MYHTVESGDDLWKIADEYETTVDEFFEINSISNLNLITVGVKI